LSPIARFGLILPGFGGKSNPSKVETTVQKGDVIIIPAGVSHRLLDDFNGDFQMVGSYPHGKILICAMGRRKKKRKLTVFLGWVGLRKILCMVTMDQL
jgi:uncharacterized protein YjlB